MHARDGGGQGRAGKRQRVSADDESSSGDIDAAYELRMSLLQESKASCAVSASVAGTVPDEVAARFTALCKEVGQDIAQILASC